MAPQQVVQKFEPSPSEGEKLEIFYDGQLYDVTNWIPLHPGGAVINYFTDLKEDATIPIQQFHHRSIKQVLTRMKALQKRPVSFVDSDMPGQSERHQKLTEDFQVLFQSLEQKGFFKPSLYNTFGRLLEVIVFLSLGLYFNANPDVFMAKSLSVIFMVTFFSRCGFLAHEAGHGSLTGNTNFDRFLETLLFNLSNGMSATFWSSHHNRHHAMTQRVDRDMDIKTMPIIAFNTKMAFRENNAGNNFWTRNQAILFYIVDTFLVGLVWKLYSHPKYMYHKRQYDQLAFYVAHYICFLYLLGPWTYLLNHWLASIWIFGTITLSHSHLPVAEDNLHWVEYSFLHTTNVSPSWWCDWVMGYLNYQVEHHLFPAMPNFRQRQVSKQVKAYALKHNLPYQCISYPRVIWATISNLNHVSNEIVKHRST